MFNEIEIASRVKSKHLSGVEEFFLTKSKVPWTSTHRMFASTGDACRHVPNRFDCLQVYLVQNLIEGGVLCDDMMLRPGQRYKEDEAKCIIEQVLQGVAYLHAR